MDEYRVTTSHSWCSVILFYSSDEYTALQNFFTLLVYVDTFVFKKSILYKHGDLLVKPGIWAPVAYRTSNPRTYEILWNPGLFSEFGEPIPDSLAWTDIRMKQKYVYLFCAGRVPGAKQYGEGNREKCPESDNNKLKYMSTRAVEQLFPSNITTHVEKF